MYDDRRTSAYREGVHSFRDAADANKHGGGYMFCPCVECQNEKDYTSSRVIQSHLLGSGFMSGYNVWTKHGERGVMMEDDDEEEENDDDNYLCSLRMLIPQWKRMKNKIRMKNENQMSPLMILAGSFLMHGEERLQFEQML